MQTGMMNGMMPPAMAGMQTGMMNGMMPPRDGHNADQHDEWHDAPLMQADMGMMAANQSLGMPPPAAANQNPAVPPPDAANQNLALPPPDAVPQD